MTTTTHSHSAPLVRFSKQAAAALYAVQLKRTCGPWSARRYAIKHGVLGLYRLAQQLEAVQSTEGGM